MEEEETVPKSTSAEEFEPDWEKVVEELMKKHVEDNPEYPLDKMTPHPSNPRHHPESLITKIENSIKFFGKVTPIVLDQHGTILSGHARYKAAQRMGLKTFPVRIFNFDDAQATMWMIADNRLNEESDWDMVKLKDLILPMEENLAQLEVTGFTEAELNLLLNADDQFGFDIKDSGQNYAGDYQGEVENRSWVAIVRFATKEKAEAFLKSIGAANTVFKDYNRTVDGESLVFDE